jgi:oxalate decarboxylase/phosphoglucose isomerase-like protein (cupin superfamily)
MTLNFNVVPTLFYTPPSTFHYGTNSSAEEVFWLLCQPVKHSQLYLLIQSEVMSTQTIFYGPKELKSLGAKSGEYGRWGNTHNFKS